MRFFLVSIPLLAAMGFSSASAQQRVAFERQKFDRSRFERPDLTARPPLPGSPAAPSPAAPSEPLNPSAPMPMVTEQPAPTPSTPSEFIFSFTNSAGGSTATAPAAPADTAIFSSNSVLPAYPPPSLYPAGATPEEKALIDAPLFEQIPAKWFDNAKDYSDLVELQKKTGACLLVYFKNPGVPNEKGLCNWFEKTVTTDIPWRKAMKYYLKIEIYLPGNSMVEELAAKYRVVKTPAFFVVKPGSTFPTRIKLFDYPVGSRPVPILAAPVIEALKAASTPAYQPLF